MVKNIKEAAPLLAYYFIDEDLNASLFEANKRMTDRWTHRLGLFRKYIGVLHDSPIIESEIADAKFSLVLNDFETHLFACTVAAKNHDAVDHDRLVFPLRFDFETTRVVFHLVDAEGDLPIIAPTAVNTYLAGQIVSVDHDEMEIALLVSKEGADDGPYETILIVMRVKELGVTEYQDLAWLDLFDETYKGCYTFFKEQRSKGRYLSDQSQCMALYEEYSATHNRGLTQSHTSPFEE